MLAVCKQYVRLMYCSYAFAFPGSSKCREASLFLQCWQHVSSTMSKTWGFCGMSKNAGRRGTFEEDLQRRIFRGRQSTRDMFIRAVRRSGRWFPARELRPSGLLRRFCVTGAALRMTWRAKCWEGCAGNSPRHNESERTGTKCREGCTSNIDIRTSPQGERSNTPKVTKRLRKHMLDFTKHCAHHEKLTLKVSKTRLRHLWARSPKRTLGFRALFFTEVYKVLRLPRKTSPRHPKCCTRHTESSSCPKSKITRLSTLSFTKYCACSAKWPPKAPLIFTHACQRFSNVQKGPRLPHRWKVSDVPHLSRKMKLQTSKCPGCPTPATRSGHGSKKQYGALVKRDLRKSQNRTVHLVPAWAVDMHMGISQGNFCARIDNEKAGAIKRILI